MKTLRDMMSKKYLVKAVFTAFFSFPSVAAPMAVNETAEPVKGISANPVVLGVYDAEADADMTVVTARLSEKPSVDSVKLENHGSFFQITLPNVVVPHPGQFIEGKGPYAKKLAAYQISPTDAAIRIFIEGDSKAVGEAATAEILNDRVVISIDHRGLAKAASPAATAVNAETAKDGVSTDGGKSGDLSPADLARVDPNTAGVGTNVIDLSSRLNSVAVFSGVMLLGLLGAYFSKNIIRRRRRTGDSGESFQMKTLSSMALAPKQRIALIEVCNERFLVGVSPGQISYLTSLNPTPKAQKSMLSSEPQVGLPAQIQQYFQRQAPLMQQPAVDLKPAPSVTLDDAPVAEVKSKVTRPAKRTMDAEKTTTPKEPQRRINIAISDDGIESRNDAIAKRRGQEQIQEEPKDIGDVTRLIREKFKNLSASTSKT